MYTKGMGFPSLSISSTYGCARPAADPVAARCNMYLMTGHLLGRPCRQTGLEGRYQKTSSDAQRVYVHGVVLLET